MLWSSDSEDEPCSCVLNRLESRDEVGVKLMEKKLELNKLNELNFTSLYFNSIQSP